MRDPRLTKYAKANRKQMSEPAMRIWLQLRAKRLEGVKFYREKVIGEYIADFSANSPKLVSRSMAILTMWTMTLTGSERTIWSSEDTG